MKSAGMATGEQQTGECDTVKVMRVWCRSLQSAIKIQLSMPLCMDASAALLPDVSTVFLPAGSDMGVEWLIEDRDLQGLDATASVQSETADWLKFFA